MGKKWEKKKIALGICFFLEAVLLFSLFVLFNTPVFADIGQNVTVITNLTVGNVYPEVLNVSLEDNAASVVLVANDTKLVQCVAVVRDYNGEADIKNVSAEFFDSAVSSYGDSDDNNYHYTNLSCVISNNFGSYNGYSDDAYTALANCTFSVWYYANAETWMCTVLVNDTHDLTDSDNDTIEVSPLLSIGLPERIDYGEVNATDVSDEKIANVTNFGNVEINLSLEGYAVTEGDGLAMNCTLGAVQNISIEHEKYNLTSSTVGQLTLAQTELYYLNLSSSEVLREFALGYRQNDTFNHAANETYWRIYVPLGVAGTCQGHIIFGARQGVGT